MKEKTKRILTKIINITFQMFKIQIVFESGRDLIDGNAKAIYDYMKKQSSNNYRLIWLVTKNTDVSNLDKKDYVYYKTLKGYFHIATSHYWIKNQSIKTIISKRKGQIYIQLFHGNGVMKKMGYDVTGEEKRPPLEHTKDWDYYIANDQNDKNVITSSTGYQGKIEVLGMACIDTTKNLSKDKQKQKAILKSLNITNNKKNILYAPTFRDTDLNKEKVSIPIEKLQELEDYNIIIRLHPQIRTKVEESIFNKTNFINGCNYPDASELLTITDILITDYSSIFYEYLILNRPIIFYPYDYQEYINIRGGFYIDYQKELPGPICYSEEQLLNTITNIDTINNKYKTKRDKFNKKYNRLSDGKASERFVKALINNKFN